MQILVCGLQTNPSLSSFCVRDPFQAHREHMRQMMRSFSEPFGGPMMPSITDGRRPSRDLEEQAGSSRALREEHRVSRCRFVLIISEVVNPGKTSVYCSAMHRTRLSVTQWLFLTPCALCTEGAMKGPQIKSVWM